MPEAILRCHGRHKGFCLHWMANDSLVELEKKKKKMDQIQSDNGSQNGTGFSGDGEVTTG